MTILYTPTVEATVDEAFEGFVRHSATASHYGLGARGRDGKKSLRCSTAAGFTREHSPVEAGSSRPYRLSCDVQFETISNTVDSRFLAIFNPLHSPGTASSGAMAVRLGLNAAGNLYVAPEVGESVVTSKTLRVGVVYALEVELLRSTSANGLVRVWVDGEKVFERAGNTTINNNRTSLVAARFEGLTTATTGGVHFSNILIGDVEGAQIGAPFGPLDFAYVPVQDASMGGTVTSDDTFTTFSDSVFKDFPLEPDGRAGASVAWTPRLRASTDDTNPGQLDLRANGGDVFSALSLSAGFQTYRPSVKFEAVPLAISLRNSPAT